MTDQTPATPPSALDRVKGAGQGILDFIAWAFSWTFGMIPQAWRKWCALVVLFLAVLWFMHTELEWKVPSWSQSPVTAIDTGNFATKTELAAIDSRVRALESVNPVEDPPKALSPIITTPVKTDVIKPTQAKRGKAKAKPKEVSQWDEIKKSVGIE